MPLSLTHSAILYWSVSDIFMAYSDIRSEICDDLEYQKQHQKSAIHNFVEQR